ncbi:MAG: VOC family protein [Firmicutes bacterium]|nr:VOC family protein [Bacillota bacterium]
MALINKLHHIAMRCDPAEQYEKTVHFYTKVLGLPVCRTWEGGTMVQAGDALLEIFSGGETTDQRGIIAHFALGTDDLQGCIDAVTAAGYEIISGPRQVTIPSDPAFPLACAFCRGPLGEEIEFFQEL